ncbi:MAG TPA: PilN domain-containing protein [Planctomycetota bacterium]|nr:PilN domain-containing protein [Planctomycetota bacterium]
MPSDILSIDLDRHAVRAVVVKRRGQSAHVSGAVEVPVHEGVDPVDVLDDVLKALGRPPKRVVAVSPGARLFACELQVPYNQARKLDDDKLKSTARWEVEPYLEFPPADGLFSTMLVDPQTRRRTAASAAVSSSTTLQVCVASKDAYTHLKEACRRRGLTLQRLYGTDTAFAYAGVGAGNNSSPPDAVVDLRNESTVAAMLHGADVLAFRSVHTSLVEDGGDSDKLAHAIAEAVKEFGTEWGKPGRVVITGAGAAIDDLPNHIASHCGVAAVPWSAALTKGAVITHAGHLGAEFASAVGAALLELGLCGSTRLGVNDRVPLSASLKANLHLVPIALVALAFPVMGINYLSLQAQTRKTEQLAKELKAEKDKLEGKRTQSDRTEKELAALRQKIVDTEKEIAFFEKLSSNSRLPVVELLDDLSSTIPDDVVLAKIEEQRPNEFIVSGFGLEVGSISTFVARIQQLPWCAEVKPPMVEEVEIAKTPKTALNSQFGDVMYSFTFSVRMKPE